jgi:hypothetical protein
VAARLACVLGATALLETLEHLALARGKSELGVAIGDVGLVALELADAHRALCLDVFDEGLVSKQLGGVDWNRSALVLSSGEALVGASLLEVVLDGAQAIMAAVELENGTGKLLAGEVLGALAQGADALEAETERWSGAHGRVIGRSAPFLRGAARWSVDVGRWGWTLSEGHRAGAHAQHPGDLTAATLPKGEFM